MKLKKVLIENFKGISSLELDLSREGDPRFLTALIGDNGSGKTTALQAIALVLSLATRRIPSPKQLNWHGFLADRISTLGTTRVQLTVLFDHQEIAANNRLFQEWSGTLPEELLLNVIPPSAQEEVCLIFQDGKLTSPQGPRAIHQLAGRYYLGQLMWRSNFRIREDYANVGSVFWFDQMRNLGRPVSSVKEEDAYSPGTESWQSGVEQLREYLVGMWAHHTSAQKNGKDYIPELLSKFNLIFRDIQFVGVEPRGTEPGPMSDFYFLLERDGKVFDISEMSSGEQAVFPLIYEFVRLNIAKSVVLIDELELHLHPPQQQALLGALSKFAPDCQFIVTTHSRYIESVIPEEEKIRLEGGRPCL